MTDRIVVTIALGILAGAFLWQDQPGSAAGIAILWLLYLWKGKA